MDELLIDCPEKSLQLDLYGNGIYSFYTNPTGTGFSGNTIEVQYSTVQYSNIIEVQYSTVQYSTVQCSAVQCSAVQCSTVQCSAVQCSPLKSITVQYSAVQCSAVQCSISSVEAEPVRAVFTLFSKNITPSDVARVIEH